MRDMVNQQRHELCAKDHELSHRSEEVEAVSADAAFTSNTMTTDPKTVLKPIWFSD